MRKILIIDDQQCTGEYLATALTSKGYCVEMNNGICPKSIKRQLMFWRPDLVLLELFTDGTDRFELLQRIKRLRPDLPVIICTAYDTFQNDPRLSKADGYVIKSMNLTKLKQAIVRVFEQKAQRAILASARQSQCFPTPIRLAEGL